MKKPELPVNETERLMELESYGILDTAPDEVLDALTRLATVIFHVPIALVSLVDAQRQWFKSRQGLEATETSREISFCGHAVSEGTALIVPDACDDERFADNPLVVGSPGIRFYAGVLLRSSRGLDLGTFCIIDRSPRQFSDAERKQLEALTQLAIAQLDSIRKLAIMQLVVDAVPSMLAYWDNQQRCRFANAAYENWFGVRPEDLVGHTLEELLGPNYERNRPFIEGALRGETQLFEREIPKLGGSGVRHSQAHYLPHLTKGGVQGFVVMVVDISAQKTLETEIREANAVAERLARHDGLTGLPNRMYIQEQLERLYEYSKRYGRGFAILYIDLDGFKTVNDKMGHAAGDAVLVEVARRLRDSTRSSDIVGRLGGDEFVVFLPEIEHIEPVQVAAEKLLRIVASPPIEVNAQPTGVTLSIGVALYPTNGTALKTLIANADAALYQAKRLGKNQFAFHIESQ
jgi:diguanylate cyclase (GGDEF)-like protein/PAS domain S-box-containing protein